ncbi:hypothetical protein M2G70_07330 [Vibrio vulnificus]|nr:hypothetical protein [Vibrio vulnificus]
MIGSKALATRIKVHRDLLDETIEKIRINLGAFEGIEWNNKKGYMLTDREADFLTNFFLN